VESDAGLGAAGAHSFQLRGPTCHLSCVTLLILALVLGSALIHASWNLWAKQIGDGGRRSSLLWLLTTLSALFYAPFALALLVWGGARPDASWWPWILGSGVIHVGYFYMLLAGYRRADLSLVYPVARGTGPLLAALGALAWFGERLTLPAIAGIALVVAGVAFLSLRPGMLQDKRSGQGLRYGLATGAFIAVYTLWDAWAVKRVGIAPLVFYWSGEVARVLLLSPLALADRPGVLRVWREHRWRVLGIALLSPLSYILILIAFQHGNVSHIAPARELSILIGAYLGARVLGEGERWRRMAAAAAFAAGVILLALA
jgi:drug/metabolite transporter (DMT)-like permease